MLIRLCIPAVLVLCPFYAAAGAQGDDHAQATARQVLEATGIQGGLVVHVGCGDGRLTAALHAGDACLVHGLDTDPANVAKARQAIASKGLYGKVSAEVFDGAHLPYVDNLVNLVVSEDLGKVPMAEVLRVLAPLGVAYVKQAEKWVKTVKPRPADIDEWTHFLHDSGGNAVAEDEQVGPPRSLHWVAGPLHCRSHEFPTSVEAEVTSGGRLFTIFDEGPTGVYEKLPQNCRLIARDAFNGKLLWKVPLQKWDTQYGTGQGGRWAMHQTIPRRLVAQGDRVYVTLQFMDSPVSVLDAATGKVLVEALEGTAGTDEIVLADGVLYAVLVKQRSPGATERIGLGGLSNSLVAVDVRTGKALWRKPDVNAAPYTLAARDGRVVYHNLAEIVCLDAKTGREAWRTENRIAAMQAGLSCLVVRDGAVLYHSGSGSRGGKLTVLDLKDGRKLWDRNGFEPLSGACTLSTEVFVIDGKVWCGLSQDGLDLRTGQVAKHVDLFDLITPGHHRRCIRGNATVHYVIQNKRGAEFVDVRGTSHMRNDWLRTPCFTAGMPANGLFYVPSNQCFCYPGVLVNGYMALASGPVRTVTPSPAAALEKGAAYGKDAGPNASDDDWPMYRRTPLRNGAAPAAVPADLAKRWQITLKSPAAQPVIVGDRVWVAEKDAQTIRCLNAGTGEEVWRFIAGGRIDSSPTVYEGRVLFGCRDGCVYSLRAGDGELAWRFRAAPADVRTVAFEQVESLWPVHGSVLVQDGVVYCAAGRSSFLDGGIAVYGLDAQTGGVLYHHVLEGPQPDIRKSTSRPFAMDGALSDLLVSDAKKNLYMMQVKFDARLNRQEMRPESPLGELDMGEDHLVATGGFLDDTNFDRIYWMYSKRWPGFYFAQQAPKSGQLVVFDDSTTYAVKFFYRRHVWSPKFFPQDKGYLLFADDNTNEPDFPKGGKGAKGAAGGNMVEWLPKESATDTFRRGGQGTEKGTGYVRTSPEKWQTMIPVRVRAMVLAGDRLIVAGPPDVLVAGDPLAAFEGRAGAVLQVFSAADGKLLKKYPLPVPPVFDGMSAAGGRLYLALTDGTVLCLGAER